MKKNIIISIIILAIIIIIVLLSNNKKQEENMMNVINNENNIENLSQNLKEYYFDINQSKIVWESKKTFLENWIDRGNISVKSGKLSLEDDNLINGEIIIDMNSITANTTGANSGEDKLTMHLKSEDFFNVNEFPTSEFILKSITKTEIPNIYKLNGNLTIKNITKNMDFEAEINIGEENITINSTIVIDRSLFDVKFGSNNFFEKLGDKTIDNNFTLKLNLIAKK